MTRATGSTHHLGGIGLMLELAHICPRCGKQLSDSPTAAVWHLDGNGCRPVVYAALPDPEATVAEDDPPTPAGRQIHDFEAPAPPSHHRAPFGVVDPVASIDDVGRPLTTPWLRPPDLGEVL